MTLKELKKKLMKRISVHPNMKLEWGGIFTFKVNIIIIKVDNGELCYIIQKKKMEYQIFYLLRNEKHMVASFDAFFDMSAEDNACKYFDNWIMREIG